MRFNQYELPNVKLFHSAVEGGHRPRNNHHHTECEISAIVHGNGVYSVQNRDYDFHEGDVFMFGSDEVHFITEISSESKFEILNIHFEPQLLWNNGDRDALILLKLFFDRSDSFSNRLDRQNPVTPKIRNMIFDIENEFRLTQSGYEFKIKLNLFGILFDILRNYNYINPQSSSTLNKDTLSRLSIAMDYINSHLTDRLTLDEVARKATMGKAYFSTVFKKFNGISPWDYITIKRVEKAIDMLKTTNMSKLEIASQCGFNSSANFYKAFSRITGKTPGDYSVKS